MITHIQRWKAYGGADDDIFLTFGISPLDFYGRVVAAVLNKHPAATGLSDDERRGIWAYCSLKYRHYQGRHRHSLSHVPMPVLGSAAVLSAEDGGDANG